MRVLIRISLVLMIIPLTAGRAYGAAPTREEIGSWIGPQPTYGRKEVITLIEELMTLALEEIESTVKETGEVVAGEQQEYYDALNESLADELERSRKREKNWERGCLILGGALIAGIGMEVAHAVGFYEK